MKTNKNGNIQCCFWLDPENYHKLAAYVAARGRKRTTIVNEIFKEYFEFIAYYNWRTGIIIQNEQTPAYYMGRFVALFLHLTDVDAPTQHRRMGLIMSKEPKMIGRMVQDANSKKVCERYPILAELATKFTEQNYSSKLTPEEAVQFETGYWHERNKFLNGNGTE